MEVKYQPKGVCSQQIVFTVEDDKVQDVEFTGGCNGNLKGIAALVKGMPVTDVITKLEGIQCRSKATSCPDQFAQALKSL